MRLTSLHIQNFRALEDFKVKKLGRLNLIVGKNNSGKSSVLEALRIYAGNANQALLAKIAEEHGEKYRTNSTEWSNEDNALPFESFFTGRHFPDNEGKSIAIGNNLYDAPFTILKHVYVLDKKEIITNENGEISTRMNRRFTAIKSELSEFDAAEVRQAIFVSSADNIRGSFIFLDKLDRSDTFLHRRDIISPSDIPCSYIPTQFVSLDELAREWDKIVLTEYENSIRTALRFIENDFESIAFIKEDSLHLRASRLAIVKMKNIKTPIPLGSMGDGMVRVLQLALKAFSAKGGFLLIDEFENGLHFSIQEEIWAWLFELCEQLDIQLFATTHSWDCVESFTKVALQKEAIESALFRVGRSVRTSDNGKVIAIEFDRENFATISQADVEVR